MATTLRTSFSIGNRPKAVSPHSRTCSNNSPIQTTHASRLLIPDGEMLITDLLDSAIPQVVHARFVLSTASLRRWPVLEGPPGSASVPMLAWQMCTQSGYDDRLVFTS